MSLSLRRLQAHLRTVESNSHLRRTTSSSSVVTSAEETNDLNRLEALSHELSELAEWEKNGVVTAAERKEQATRLVAAKIPTPTAHGPVALAVLTALNQWQDKGHLDEAETIARRAEVLRGAAAGSQRNLNSFAASQNTAQLPASLSTTAPISTPSPPSSGSLTRSVLEASCRIARRVSREAVGATGAGSPSSASPSAASPRSNSKRCWPKAEVAASALEACAAADAIDAELDDEDAERDTPSPPAPGSNRSEASKVSFALPPSRESAPGSSTSGNTSPTSTHRGSCSPERSCGPSASASKPTRRQRFSNEGYAVKGPRRPRMSREDKQSQSAEELSLQGADLTDLDLLLNQLRKGRVSERKRTKSTSTLLNANELSERLSAASKDDKRSLLPWSCLSRIPVFDPDNRLLTMWQLIVFTFVVVSAIVVPLMVAFESEMPVGTRRSLAIMDLVFDLTFIADILISMNIAYRKDGFLVTVRKLILMNYLRTWFALDFISSFPLSWFTEQSVLSAPDDTSSESGGEISRINKLLRLMKLGKLLRILKLFKIFDRIADNARFNPATFRLLTLAISLFFMSHLFGCLWYMILSWGEERAEGTLYDYALRRNATLSDEGHVMREEWRSLLPGSLLPPDGEPRYPLDALIDADQMGHTGVALKWLLCFTWAMGLFTGLMPVDLQPWRPEEMAFTIIALVFAMAFNAMIISACSSAMASMDYIARHHKAKLDRVRDYMRFNSVPSELSHTIMEYYKYICLNSQTQDDLKDFVDLPQQLHFKLAIALHRELISNCNLFREFDNNSILRILSFLRPLTLPPETVVLRQGHAHSAMYFVSRGMC